MDKHPHIIGRQIFDIDFSSKEASELLQDKISSIFNNRLINEINSLFDKVLPSNRIIKLDTLNIDLGNIDYELLDTELPNKLIEKLEEELMLILLHDNAAPAVDSVDIFQDDKKGSYLQLLEFFILKGTFPWWVSVTDGPSISDVLEFLLLNSSLKLKELIMRIGQNNNARKRLVQQFTEQQIKYIIIILEPDEAEFIFDYHQNVVQVQREVILVKNEESDFQKAIWYLILSFLIIDKGSHFNRKEFVRNMLKGMAAHFNINFSELLSLFAAGLRSGSPELRNIDSLQTIILELFEEEEANFGKNVFMPEKYIEKDLLKISDDIDLLRYYLTFGSFPWWSFYSDKQSIDLLLTSMLSTQPKTMAVLLRNIGQQQYSRKLIVKRFSEEILLSIVTLLEPEQTEFIADYITEAKESNIRNSKLKVQILDLTEAVWEFVLEYLLVDRGSEFNRQMFLESNIRNLANRFNANFIDILVFLVQSISVRHHASARHISLIRDLGSLYKIRIKEVEMPFQNQNQNGALYQIPQIIASKSLRDILYYWLKFGHFPWWTEKLAKSGVSVLIEQLFNESPAEAILFFKFSGQNLTTRRRMMNQASTSILFKLFRSLADGNKAVRYTEKIILLFSGNPLFQPFEQNMMERISLASLWDMYVANAYESFKSGDFLISFLINLSLSTDISIQNITLFLNSLALDKQLRTQLNKVIRRIDDNGENTVYYLFGRKLPVWSKLPEIELILTEQLKSNSLNTDLIDAEKVFDEATFILRYFLQYNRLPEKFKQSTVVSVNAFIKQLLLFLHKNSAADLDRILSSEKYDAQNLLGLHDLLRQSDSIEENNLRNFIATKFEKNILLFIRQKGGIGLSQKSLNLFIEKLINNPISESNSNILRLLFRSPSVSGYFAHFLKDSLVYEIFEAVGKNVAHVPEGIIILNTWLLGLLNDRLDKERFELYIRSFNLMILGGIIKSGNINTYYKQLLNFLAEDNYQLMLKITSSLSKTLNSNSDSDRLIISQIPEIGKLVSRTEKFDAKMEDLKKVLMEAERTSYKDILDTNPDELKESQFRQLKREIMEQQQAERQKSAVESLSDKDSIYIHNSGLVILHPFLSTYFNRLNMFENGDFKTEEYRFRAVHLLQYLAFGTENNEEHELVLNKILCNIPIDEPVSSGIVLSEQERVVSGELINAILVQWDKLKNTSAESFQASFLQRDGALSRIEENWNLKVESRGYDVLLNTLPWGLGMIKTPWMTEFIYVEWI